MVAPENDTRICNHDTTTFIAIDGIDTGYLGEKGVFTLASGVHDAVREETDHTPKGVEIYVSCNGNVDTAYVGIIGVTEDELTSSEGRKLTGYVFSLLRETPGLCPTEIALVVDYRSDMKGEPRYYRLPEQ